MGDGAAHAQRVIEKLRDESAEGPCARLAALVVEDVITTGGSTLKAAEKLRAAGFAIAGVVALVDRLEGGREALKGAGLTVTALYTRRDFIAD